ncbi:MAG: DUF1566 domain-containing protein [Nitrospirae bacterium]|nr:DUF1566 domain-containing protein [Nitrospirota bacterium]
MMFQRFDNPGCRPGGRRRNTPPQGYVSVRTLLALTLIAVIGAVLAGVAHAATVSLPQTGQTMSYYAGDDGAIKAGVAWPNPRFTVNADQTVTDNLTGLAWTKGANPSVGSCKGMDMTWQAALDHVACLNAANYLGYNNWRLPNINELESLFDFGSFRPTSMIIDSFSAIWFGWSSTTYAYSSGTGNAWYIEDNGIDPLGKSYNYSVWPVRSGESVAFRNSAIWQTGQTTTYAAGDDGDIRAGVAWPNPRFTDNGNKMVTDNLTGLIWTKDAGTPTVVSCTGGKKTWQGALDYVACLNTANYLGHRDWRLPNIKELRSIVDYGKDPFLTSDLPFTNKYSGYWSSTTYDLVTSGAWGTDLTGSVIAGGKSDTFAYVWPVRAGQVDNLADLVISRVGAGSGSVTSMPSGINCGSVCIAIFAPGTSVTLTATEGSGSTFAGWSGDCTGTSKTCAVTTPMARNITATFSDQSCSYTIYPTSKSFTSTGGSDSVSVTTSSNCSWSATSNVSWITITSGSTGVGNGTVAYTVSANTSASSRLGTMTIAGQTFTVLQDRLSCDYTITPTSKNFSSPGGSDNVSVTVSNSTCSWTAKSNDTWLSISSDSTGAGNGTVSYTAAANPTANVRIGTITIAGQTFTVTQDGQSATKKTLTIVKQGTGNGSVKVLLTVSTTITWLGNTGVAEYDFNTSVTLTADGDMSSDFVKWDKCDTVSSNVCTVKMDTSKTVVVTFNTHTQGFALTVTKTGTGDGVVTPSIGVLTFNAKTATTSYPEGSQVILKGVAADGSSFIAWTGCDVPIGSQCTVNMTADKGVSIEFRSDGKRPKKDFDGDGKTDVLWRNVKTGDVVLWLMNGSSISQGSFIVKGMPAQWEIKGIGDFDGDGKADVLWQDNNNGDVYIWLMDGAKINGGDYAVHGVPKDWAFRAVGDLDGDGKADILWQNTKTGDVAVWFMDGARISHGDFVVKGMPPDWTLKAVADLNNDGKADMIWQAANGDVYVWLMDGVKITGGDYAAKAIPGNWQVKAVDDFDGDGKNDILWQDTTTGDVAIWLMDGSKVIGGNYVVRGMPRNWQVIPGGDFNGDGKADILWQDTQSGDVAIWLMDGLKITNGDFATKALPLDWSTR